MGRGFCTGFGSEWDAAAAAVSLAEEAAPAFASSAAAAPVMFCRVPAHSWGAQTHLSPWTLGWPGCVGTAEPSCHPSHRAAVLGELGLWTEVQPASGAGLGPLQLCYSPCFCALREQSLTHCQKESWWGHPAVTLGTLLFEGQLAEGLPDSDASAASWAEQFSMPSVLHVCPRCRNGL